MNVEDLKQRMFDISTRENITDRKSLLKLLNDAIDSFEQSNKSEEELDSLTSDELQELIYTQIKSLDEKYCEFFSEQKKEIEALKKQVEAIDKVKVIDSDIQSNSFTLNAYLRAKRKLHKTCTI